MISANDPVTAFFRRWRPFSRVPAGSRQSARAGIPVRWPRGLLQRRAVGAIMP